MKLSIIIPAHNEEATISQVLEKVAYINIAPWEKEIIVVNDGSTDNTKHILETLSPERDGRHKMVIVHHEKNLGKGAAIQTGLKQASGDYVIIQDADLEYDPSDIPGLLSFIANPNNNTAIFGKRGYKAYPERGFHYVIGAWLLTNFFNLLFWQKLTDLYTGYKLIPTQIFKELNIKSTGFEFEAEVACKLVKKGVKLIEVPINYKPRNKEQGKHIRFKDALVGFWTTLKLRF
jgi:dolichol-phosphate mannosyltransferase